MNAVNRMCGNIRCTLKTKRHICSPDVIVNRFWQGKDMQSFLPQKIRCFMGSISSKNHQAFQLELPVMLLHGFHLIQTIFIRYPHQLKRLTGGAQNRTAFC